LGGSFALSSPKIDHTGHFFYFGLQTGQEGLGPSIPPKKLHLWNNIVFLNYGIKWAWKKIVLHFAKVKSRQPLVGMRIFKVSNESKEWFDYCWKTLTTEASALRTALWQDRHPLVPIVLSGPLQPLTQFAWHGRHTLGLDWLALYLFDGHWDTQCNPSRRLRHFVQCSGPGPWQPPSHSEWHAAQVLSPASYSLCSTVNGNSQ